MNMTLPTLEEIEAIVAQMEKEEDARRAKLCRLISAYARIISLREPEKFSRRATEWGDEDGHWDNSYPPKMEYRNRTGPLTITVISHDHEEVATSSGFYNTFKIVPSDPGLYIGTRGELWGGHVTGEGRFGQFAAHPGNCGVSCEIEWSLWESADLPTSALKSAEEHLRGLAFPSSQSSAAA